MSGDKKTSSKTVAFSDETKDAEENGESVFEDKNLGDSHDLEQPQPSSTTTLSDPLVESKTDDEGGKTTAADSNAFDDVSNMLKSMKKKKKTSKVVEEENSAPVEDGGLDLSSMKKKKKSKKTKETTEDEFAAKIAALQVDSKDGENTGSGPKVTPEIYEGDMEKGTGLWQHNSEVNIPYDKLLSRFFILLAQKNPDHFSSGSKSYKIPPPQCLREGNKKTIFANIAEICKRMKRTDEHVTSYLFAELGTSGSVDGSRRLVIKGRFQQKQIENVLRRYIMEYVTCKTCRSPDTELNKGENRLYFITCNSCGSRRSVTAIKTGFSAQVGKRRRQQG
ncbi:hypothetical protein Golomagni_02116 [Golovinomyces magnicellulatus]|nr:hypothetical protein Golomagni_02116 [Golovinomyces magnicellulatus]